MKSKRVDLAAFIVVPSSLSEIHMFQTKMASRKPFKNVKLTKDDVPDA